MVSAVYMMHMMCIFVFDVYDVDDAYDVYDVNDVYDVYFVKDVNDVYFV